MAPKKAVKGVKKEEANPEPPKASTLPDGEKSHWIGAWSANTSLAALHALTQPETGCSVVRVLPGVLDETPVDAPEPKVVVVGSVNVAGQLASVTAANKAAWEAKRGPRGGAGGANGDGDGEGGADGTGDGDGGDGGAEGEGADGDDGSRGQNRPALVLLDDSILVRGNIVIEGAKPPIEVKPLVAAGAGGAAGGAGGAVAAAGKPVKGKKDDEAARLREAEAQREREEAARVAAEAEAERLSKFAAPSKYPTISFTNIAFCGRLQVRAAHVTFRGCHFIGGPDHQVLVHQYCRVTFDKCTFSGISRSGIYCYPLSEVTVTGCWFTGIAQPRSADEIAVIEQSPKAKREHDAAKQQAQQNTASVAVYGDDAIISISNSVISFVTTGLVLNGKCAGSTVSGNFFENIFSIGIYCDGTAAAIKSNTIEACGYYGIQFVNKCVSKVLFNTVASTVQIGRGAHPMLHTNTLAMKLIDQNDVGTIALEPRY